jgi:hypothetical protein
LDGACPDERLARTFRARRFGALWGANSKAVYAAKAKVIVPALEQYEKEAAEKKVIVMRKVANG